MGRGGGGGGGRGGGGGGGRGGGGGGGRGGGGRRVGEGSSMSDSLLASFPGLPLLQVLITYCMQYCEQWIV